MTFLLQIFLKYYTICWIMHLFSSMMCFISKIPLICYKIFQHNNTRQRHSMISLTQQFGKKPVFSLHTPTKWEDGQHFLRDVGCMSWF
jgi:hypothetical protein